MNILLISTHLNYGGITSYLVTLAKGLRQRGHKVIVTSSSGYALDLLKAYDIRYIDIPIHTKAEISPSVLASFLKLRHILKNENIQIIHAQTRVTQVLAAWLARSFNIPYVTTCHGFFKRRLSRKLFSGWGSKVIAISEAVKVHLINDFKVKEEDIVLIYNGVDVNSSLSSNAGYAIKQEIGLRGLGPIIGIIGRLSEVKGHHYLILAFSQILKQIPQAELLIVGEGKTKKDLVRLVQDLKIEKNVFFVPSVSNTQRILSIMDVFVMPSIQEGLGLSIMEAMAEGVPVVASDVGGISNLIEHDTRGLLVKPKDAQGLVLAILVLLKDKKKAEDISLKGRQFIKENFSLDSMLEKTEGVYRECIEKR